MERSDFPYEELSIENAFERAQVFAFERREKDNEDWQPFNSYYTVFLKDKNYEDVSTVGIAQPIDQVVIATSNDPDGPPLEQKILSIPYDLYRSHLAEAGWCQIHTVKDINDVDEFLANNARNLPSKRKGKRVEENARRTLEERRDNFRIGIIYVLGRSVFYDDQNIDLPIEDSNGLLVSKSTPVHSYAELSTPFTDYRTHLQSSAEKKNSAQSAAPKTFFGRLKQRIVNLYDGWRYSSYPRSITPSQIEQVVQRYQKEMKERGALQSNEKEISKQIVEQLLLNEFSDLGKTLHEKDEIWRYFMALLCHTSK